MATITEDYISFETAKLLKEKGFDTPVWTRYENEDDNKIIFGDKYNWNNSPMGQISAPTLQMAMKWLREVYNLYIDITVVASTPMQFTNPIYNKNKNEWVNMYSICDSYEQACEAAIKYCLENLI